MKLRKDESLKSDLVQSIVDSISYKPGWTFTYYPPSSPGQPHRIRITGCFKDICNRVSDGGQPELVLVSSERTFNDSLAFEWMIKENILTGILEVERHETDEWLKFDGKHLNNPHT